VTGIPTPPPGGVQNTQVNIDKLMMALQAPLPREEE